MFDWTSETGFWMVAAALASALMFLGSAIAVPILIARLPADFFVRSQRGDWKSFSVKRRLLSIAKNLGGVLLIVAGIGMLVLPGQGVLTILAGLMLVNFPGKRRLELRIVSRPAVWGAVSWVRRRNHRPEFVRPDNSEH